MIYRLGKQFKWFRKLYYKYGNWWLWGLSQYMIDVPPNPKEAPKDMQEFKKAMDDFLKYNFPDNE